MKIEHRTWQGTSNGNEGGKAMAEEPKAETPIARGPSAYQQVLMVLTNVPLPTDRDPASLESFYHDLGTRLAHVQGVLRIAEHNQRALTRMVHGRFEEADPPLYYGDTDALNGQVHSTVVGALRASLKPFYVDDDEKPAEVAVEPLAAAG